MLRRLLTLASAVSLLLFAAVVVLWARSLHGSEVWQQSQADLTWDVVVERGNVALTWMRGDERHAFVPMALLHRQVNFFFDPYNERVSGPGFDVHAAGFRMLRIRHATGGMLWRVCVPGWFLCGALLVLPAGSTVALLKRRSRDRRTSRNLCPACGYDLRASPHRCPECGAPMQHTSTPQSSGGSEETADRPLPAGGDPSTIHSKE